MHQQPRAKLARSLLSVFFVSTVTLTTVFAYDMYYATYFCK